jgi:CRP/FNR family transcriptional regulator, cyclic AMP receptor protein
MSGGLLDQLDADDRRALLAKMRTRSYRKGAILFHEGEPGDSLFVIDDGHVAIRASTADGDVITLTVLGPSASFGEQALLDPRAVRTASASALDPVKVSILHRKDFDELRAKSPAVERFLIQLLAAQVRRLSVQLLDALCTPAEERVTHSLAEVADTYADGATEAHVALRQDDLASIAGTTRPTANRVLKQLETAGIVRLSRGHIVVTDVERLRRHAGGG